MTTRSTMQSLIDELRLMCQVGTAFVTLGTVTYYSDAHLQDELDEHCIIYDFESLVPFGQRSGGSTVYMIYETHVANWEGTPTVTDSVGTAISGTAFAFNSSTGRFTFTDDQCGSSRTFSGTAYDLNGAAADIWREKADYYAGAYDVTTDNHNLSRSQLYKQAMSRASYYAARASGPGGASIYAERGDM